MKRDSVEIAQDWFAMGLNYLLFIAGAITVLDLFQAKSSMLWLWIALFLVPAVYYLIIKRPQKLIPAPFFVVILGIFSMIETIVDKHDWSMYYFVILLVYIAGYFLYYFLKQYAGFLILNKTSAANIPEEDMLRNGFKQVIIFSVGSVIILFMSANIDWFTKLADYIWSGILWLLHALLSGIHTQPPVDTVDKVEEMQQNLSGVGEAIESPFFPEFLQKLAQNTAGVVVFLAFVGGFIMLITLVYEVIKKYFIPHDRKITEQELATSIDVREYCGVEKKNYYKKGRFIFWDNRKKIRKLYHKKVLQHKAELIGEREEKQLKYMTAKECCERLSEENLNKIYEKARYSAEEISAEDVRVAKS